MTQEDKQLLLKDLCSRLPYGIFVYDEIDNKSIYTISYHPHIDNCKPYLRTMSSMTDEERTKIASMAGHFNSLTKSIEVCFACLPVVDYCYSRHLDIHGLIEKGLALEAKEGMYKTE